jgi:tripartite ATP-independent transporter DctM subunit
MSPLVRRLGRCPRAPCHRGAEGTAGSRPAADRVSRALAAAWLGHGGLRSSTAPVTALNSHTLSVLPLFILMGAMAVRGGLAEALYKAAYGFVGQRPGGLAIASIGACGGFGAICGSSLATVTTMGRIAVPEMLRYGYDKRLATGAVAAGGTLGILIPPSLPMIIYATVTETSVGRLFAAGMIPGAIAVIGYMARLGLGQGRARHRPGGRAGAVAGKACASERRLGHLRFSRW